MTANEGLIARAKKVLTPNYRQSDVVLVRGEGCRVWDADGNEYLDAIAGLATCALGHCHPALTRALTEQAQKLWHVSNLFYNERHVELAEALLGATPWANRAFFCNSGAEANEAQLKLARKYHADRGHPERNEIVACHDSFHGRTLFTVTCTGQPRYQRGFEPLVPAVRHIAYGEVKSLEEALTPRTAAFIVEPILGEAGVVPAPAGYLKAARELTWRAGALLLFDEVQTGMGRTGKMWAHEWEGTTPDLMSSAKAVANGYPMAAMLATEEVGTHLTPGSHASTFGGNALGCAVALAALREVQTSLPSANQVASRLWRKLEALREGGRVELVRGRGLLIGLKLRGVTAPQVVALARARGLLVNAIGDCVVRLAPPLILAEDEADEIARRLGEAIAAA